MKFILLIFSFAYVLTITGQVNNKEVGKDGKPKYNRKEEILYDGKRYRIHNNYLTAGPGFGYASIRKDVQKMIGIDFQFHIRRQQFQVGVMMSGNEFLSNNHVQAHVCYGLRKEKNLFNLAVFAGPSYFTGVEGTPGVTAASFYDGFGAYGCVQAVTKFTYDIGIGAELFGEINYKQTIGGIKVIMFFSGSYRGQKKNYNPNVRSEPKK